MNRASGPEGLDSVLHNAARIAIVTRLVALGRMRFASLRDATGLTPGNLSSHLDALEKAGYVRQEDALIRLRPGKVISLTDSGQGAFWRYVTALEALVKDLRAMEPA